MTARQEAIARLLARGLSYAAIGAELGLSARTVQHHVERIAQLVPLTVGAALASRDRVLLWAWLTYGDEAA